MQEAREQIDVRLREIDEFWAAVVYVAPDIRRPLTRMQLEVVRRTALFDMTAQQVAAELFVSVNTVKTHLRLAYQRLGITRRAQLRDALIAAERVPEVPRVGAS